METVLVIENVMVRLTPQDGEMRLQLFNSIPSVGEPVGAPVVDFILSRNGWRNLAEHLAAMLES